LYRIAAGGAAYTTTDFLPENGAEFVVHDFFADSLNFDDVCGKAIGYGEKVFHT
jgi:hypothetical protein